MGTAHHPCIVRTLKLIIGPAMHAFRTHQQ